MKARKLMLILPTVMLLAATLRAQVGSEKPTSPSGDDSEVRPPVSKADVKIAQRAQDILNSPSKWNRADTRACPSEAKTFSLYCALQKATEEVSGNFKHRGAAMQEARFVIDEICPKAHGYQHRLMDYNNDPMTTFANIQKALRLSEEHLAKRLAEQSQGSKN